MSSPIQRARDEMPPMGYDEMPAKGYGGWSADTGSEPRAAQQMDPEALGRVLSSAVLHLAEHISGARPAAADDRSEKTAPRASVTEPTDKASERKAPQAEATVVVSSAEARHLLESLSHGMTNKRRPPLCAWFNEAVALGVELEELLPYVIEPDGDPQDTLTMLRILRRGVQDDKVDLGDRTKRGVLQLLARVALRHLHCEAVRAGVVASDEGRAAITDESVKDSFVAAGIPADMFSVDPANPPPPGWGDDM